MEVIAVLDILQGQVVRGIAGRRSEYRRLSSLLTLSSDPLDVARAIRELLGLTKIYVADLDGILNRLPNIGVFRQLVDDGFSILIDAGTHELTDAINIHNVCSAEVVVGLETCRSPDELQRISTAIGSVTFSLDLLHGNLCQAADASGWDDRPEGIVQQVVESNVNSIIVLDLSDVGMRTGGSTDPICQFIHHEFPALQLIAGGGVNSREDLRRLSSIGVNAVLVASAIHEGRLIRNDLDLLDE